MGLWEETLREENKKKQIELKDVWNPECRWERSVQEEKRKRKKAYNGQMKKKQKSIRRENERSRNGMLNEANFIEKENEPLFQAREEVQCTEKTSRQTSVPKAAISGVPPLCECAKKFIEKVKLICIENKLYYFDSPCYKVLDRTKLV